MPAVQGDPHYTIDLNQTGSGGELRVFDWNGGPPSNRIIRYTVQANGNVVPTARFEHA
jgi:hypothetical protein